MIKFKVDRNSIKECIKYYQNLGVSIDGWDSADEGFGIKYYPWVLYVENNELCGYSLNHYPERFKNIIDFVKYKRKTKLNKLNTYERD